jgi:hypothetical protein
MMGVIPQSETNLVWNRLKRNARVDYQLRRLCFITEKCTNHKRYRL